VLAFPARLLAAALILAVCRVSSASEIHFDTWTVEDGLPANSISDILQTPDGYLWLATPNGLARFDGVRFTVLDRTSDVGLDANRCVSLAPDQGGAFWVATDIGIARCAGERCTPFTGAPGLPRAPVRSLAGDGAGRVWALLDDRLLELSGGGFRPAGLPAELGSLDALGRDNHAGVYRGQAGSLERFARGRFARVLPADGLPPGPVLWAAEDQHAALWIATASGLVCLDGVRVRYRLAPQGELSFQQPANGSVSRMVAPLLDRTGALWLASSERWLTRVAEGRPVVFPPPGASLPQVNALYEDRQGNIWIATAGHGLLRVRERMVRVLGTKEGLAGDDVTPILQDRSGAIWVGTTRGLHRYDSGRVTVYGPADGLPSESITGLHQDREGRLWVGAIGGVTVRSGERFMVPYPELGPACKLCERTSALLVDGGGTLFIGTDEHGVVRRDRDGSLTVLTKRDGLASDTANVIVEDRGGAVWVGGREGLTRIERGTLTAFTERDGLPSNRVRALTEGQDGTLWIATYDGGLARRKGGRFTHVSTVHGLFSNDVSQVLPDGLGNLWLSSNRGVYRVSEKQVVEVAEGRAAALTSRSFGQRDGMRSVVCQGGRWPAGIRTRDGELWFPTREGVAILDPRSVPLDGEPPSVRIEAAVVDQKAVPLSRSLRLVPGQSALELRYTALSLVDSDHLQFVYKLEGIDPGWVVAGTRRTAYYTHLPPGSYQFRVEAANADGVRSREAATLEVIVVPPFWRTPYFGIPVAAGALLLAFVWHRRRLSLVEEERRRQVDFSRRLLAMQEEERKRIAGELHDSVGQSLAVIKNHALLGLAAPAPTSALEQLRVVAETSSQTIDEVRQIAYGLRPHLLERLGLTRTLESLARTVGDSQGLMVETDLESIDGLLSPEAEIGVFRIVQESLSNTVKHAQATSVRIATRRRGARAEVEVSDDGRGFAIGESSPSDGRPRGLGLVGMTERGRLIGAEVSIVSVPGKGTRVTIVLG